MSDTPETDAFFLREDIDWEMEYDLCRKLERERDAFEKELAYVREALLDAMPNVHGSTKKLAELLVKERDSNQRQADALLDQLGAIQERMIDAERERDILKKHISIMDISHKTANDEYFKLAVENENLERERDAANALARAGKRVADICEEKMLEAELANLKLERERDEAVSSCHIWQDGHGKIVQERDDLRNELNFTVRLSRTWEDDVSKVTTDRDYWRAEAERWLSKRQNDDVFEELGQNSVAVHDTLNTHNKF